MMTPRTAIAMIAASLLVVGGHADAGERDETIKGIWAAQSMTILGVHQPDDPTRGAVQMAFDGRAFLQMAGSQIAEEGHYEVDPGKNPRTIDLVIEKGPGAGHRQLGVFQINGDILTLTLSEPGARRRPKSVDARGAGAVVVLKRVRR